MVNVFDFVDESRHQPWAELCVELENLQEHKIRGCWECNQQNTKVGNEHSEENLIEMPGVSITFLGEIGISQWSSDQLG